MTGIYTPITVPGKMNPADLSDEDFDRLLDERIKNLLLKGAEAVELLRPVFTTDTLTAATGVVALLLPLTSVPFPLFVQMLGFAMGMEVRLEPKQDADPVEWPVPKDGGDVN